MFSVTKPAVPPGPALVLVLGLVGGAWLSPLAPRLHAQESRDGLFITVANPITDAVVSQIQGQIQDAIKDRNLTTIVFDFNPQGQPSATTNFGSCNDLAGYIQDLRRGQNQKFLKIATYAFVHNEVTRNTVLPVLACKHIIMADEAAPGSRLPQAKLGNVTAGLAGDVTPTMKTAYNSVAKDFPSPDVIARLLDKDLVLQRVKTNQGSRFLSKKSLQEVEKSGQPFSVDPDQPDFLQTGTNLFEPLQALELGLCSAIQNSRAELAAALRLPRHSLTEGWLAGRAKVPWRIEARGSLDKGKLDSLERRINTALGRHANFIILQLDSEGGDLKHIASTAQVLRRLKDQANLPVVTVAWVPPGRALGAATFLALGCNEIVMGKDAVLADFSYLKDENLEGVKAMLVPLAKEQGYPPLLCEAALSKNLALYRVKSRKDPGDERLLTEEEFQKDALLKNPLWKSFGRIDREKGKLLKITAALAKEFQIARATDVDSLDALYASYGLASNKVRVARDDWLDQVAEFFREPAVNFILIMVGIIGLIMEMKMPGTTVPGVIAAICFVLFFWAYSFVGEFTLLAVLLFVLGLILLGVEIFIVPGFGFPGVAGFGLLITSLVVVTLDHMPQTAQDWIGLGTIFGRYGLIIVVAFAGAFVLAWYLPSIPYANRLVLKPPAEAEHEEAVRIAAGPALLGAMGVAATPLRPAGKVQFGDDFLDVVAEGDYVQPGSRVQVIEIEGNRIMVKEI